MEYICTVGDPKDLRKKLISLVNLIRTCANEFVWKSIICTGGILPLAEIPQNFMVEKESRQIMQQDDHGTWKSAHVHVHGTVSEYHQLADLSQGQEHNKNKVKLKMMVQMEKLVRQCDMEVMKMAMLKHEETFKQQVYELHRLYRVQKQLMSDLNRSPPELTCWRRQRRKQHARRRALNLQLPADEYIVVADAGGQATPLPPPPPSSREDELALTLAVGGGGAAGRRNNKRRESSPFTSNCSGGSLTTATSTSTSSSTDSDGSLRQPPPCPRAMAFDVLHDGSTAAAAAAAPWLQQRLSLRMA
uniref:Uncharacterized protein n=2 Tax=Oryza glaberrima TaxID=4538 RepID=I1PDC0_ORYGL